MKVIKNYIYNAGYQLLSVILPLVTTPYVTRVLTKTGYGIYSYTYTNVQYFILIAWLGITIYGNREIAFFAGKGKKDCVSNTFWEIVILKAISSAIALTLLFLLLLAHIRYKTLMVVQSINILAAALDISWFYMGLEQFGITVFRNTIVKLVSLVLIFSFVKSRQDIYIYALIMAGSLLVANITLWPHLRGKVFLPHFSDLHPLVHLKPSLMLFFPQVAIQLYTQINKTVLGIVISPTASGFYYSADTIVKVVLSVVTATGTVMLPHATKAFSEGRIYEVKKMIYTSFDFVSFISFPMAFGLAAVSLKMAPWFLGKEYYPVGKVIMIEALIIVLDAWVNALGEQYLLPIRKTQKYTASIFCGAITNVIIVYPFIKTWGLYGAMFAYCTSEIVVLIYQLVIVRNELNYQQLFNNLDKYFICSAVMFVVVFYCNRRWPMNILFLFIEVTLGIIVYLFAILVTKPTILTKAKDYLNDKK